jgi:hypothetical protein
MAINTTVLRDLASVLRQRGGQNVARLAYVKGDWWYGGRDKLQVNGTQWVARPDWIIRGWTRWWDKRITDYRLGYAVDGFIPPPRDELGDFDRDAWQVWNRGRDPWQLAWSMPLYNQVSGEEVLWSTDTMGGCDALAALLQAFADRLDLNPSDNKTLPVIELGSSSYHHPDRGEIQIPILDIIGWVVPPNKPRPALPTAAPPDALPAAKPQQAIEGPRKSLAQELNDEIGF